MNAGVCHKGAPLVSVDLLNSKRGQAWELTLDSVLHEQYANRESIVVDNGSQESLRDLVEARGPGVKLIELRENLGAGGGRNAGIREARGEIVITLDDHMSFASPLQLDKTMWTRQDRPHGHVLS